MIAATGLKYNQAFDMVKSWVGRIDLTGRQLSHAMAHGFYGCRAYVILYNETDGTFGLMHN